MRFQINDIILSKVNGETTSDKLGGKGLSSCRIFIDSPVVGIKLTSYGISDSIFIDLENGNAFFELWIGKSGHFQEISIIGWDGLEFLVDENFQSNEDSIYGLPEIKTFPVSDFKYCSKQCEKPRLGIYKSELQISWGIADDFVKCYNFSNLIFYFDNNNSFIKLGYRFQSKEEKELLLNEIKQYL